MSDVIVVGYGPCGAALSWLLASRGLSVLALERATDLHRVFRGEGLQPSGVDALRQMGLGPALEETPQLQARWMYIHNGRAPSRFQMKDGPGVRVVSQGGLLESIARHSSAHPGFQLRRGVSVTDLIWEGGRVVGVRARSGEVVEELRASLVVATDGRGSLVARKAGIERTSLEQGYDVLWLKVDLEPLLGGHDAGWIEMAPGRAALAYPSPEGLTQVGVVMAKGEIPEGSAKEKLDAVIRLVSPELGEAIARRRDTVVGPTRLSVVCERADRWSVPGLLLLGDAAHPMSPVGGQGINMALRDALVAANHLIPALRQGSPDGVDLAAMAVAEERLREIVPVQALQTRSGERMLRPSKILLWLLPWAARLGLRFGPTRERARMAQGLVPVELRV